MGNVFINDNIIFIAEIFNSLVAAETHAMISIAPEVYFLDDLIFKKIIDQDGFGKGNGKTGFVKSVFIGWKQYRNMIGKQFVSFLQKVQLLFMPGRGLFFQADIQVGPNSVCITQLYLPGIFCLNVLPHIGFNRNG